MRNGMSRMFTGLLLFAPVVAAQPLVPSGCQLPFAAISVQHPIDSSCTVAGKSTSPAPTKLQNTAKNNFCATGSPQTFTPQQLVDLQTKTKIPTGQEKEPTTRSAAEALGEGKLVRIVAFIIEAHYADLGTGESVNCALPTEEGNDIHIALGATAATPECSSVTAEISPHGRPTSWSNIGHFQAFDNTTKKNVINAALKARLQAQPFRFTGQLFFDASHEPCPCGTSCDPQRSSDWEIHPVYNIEACKSGTKCIEGQDADWIAFDSWWNNTGPAPAKKK
jgi:hypothetical protein